mmetsp:Transcript_23269/g.41171  ORF Transcript_23269/g.41171 Transcript_23269/m.41171 type:complete len:280 (-) Transcript_23269:397-1236(-)
MNALFVDQKANAPRFARFVVSGPGPLKSDVVKHSKLLKEIKNNIIAVHDVAYGFRMGLSETLTKSAGVIGSMKCQRDRAAIKSVMQAISDDDACYAIGPKDTFEAIESGAARTLIVDEDVEYQTIVCEFRSKQNSANNELDEKDHKKSNDSTAPKLNRNGQTTYFHVESKEALAAKLKEIEEEGQLRVVEIVPFVDWALDCAKLLHGVDVEVINAVGSEGLQFKKGFGGIAAITRYEFVASSKWEEDDEQGCALALASDSDSNSNSEGSYDDEVGDVFG